MQEKEAKGIGDWWKGLGKDQQYALAGSLVGGGTFGALNMLRQGKRNRFKNFLSGAAVGGLGGAAAGFGGSKLLNAKPSKPEEKPGLTKGNAPSVVDGSNFVGVGGDKPGPDRTGDSALDTGNLAEGARQYGRSALRVAGAAGAGAVGLPAVKGLSAYAGPDISRRFHNFNANSQAGIVANFKGPQASSLAQMKALSPSAVISGPGANAAYQEAARKLGPAAQAELTKRLAAHGGLIDMKGRTTDPYLRQLYGQLQKDTAAKMEPLRNNLSYLRAEEAKARAAEAVARAKATAAAGRTPAPLAAAKGGFTGRTNILGLGKMRNPLLGALLGGGFQTRREMNNGPDE